MRADGLPSWQSLPGWRFRSARARGAASEPGPEVVIAVDAGGADLGPSEVAAGAALAVAEAEGRVRVRLYGRADEFGDLPDGIEVIDAPISIAKAADPVAAVSGTPEASIVRAAVAVAAGEADALVSAGSTGAALAAGIRHVRRATGIYRPALALPLPVPHHPVTLLDVGAIVDARREHLVQFAFMGAALARSVLGVEHPRVALLSNGEETVRGNALVLETHAELRERAALTDSFTFVGNVEGGDITEGAADVVVTDGFTGNVALKLMEGVSQATLRSIRESAMGSARGRVGGLLLRTALLQFRAEIDPEGQGGAYLLGLRRLGVVPHGRFTRRGFAAAILRAQQGVAEDVVGRTHRALEEAGALKRPKSAGDSDDRPAGAEAGAEAPAAVRAAR